MLPTVTPAKIMSDVPSFLEYLDSRSDVLPGPIAVTGSVSVAEVYNARHGWVPSDTPVHDEACRRKALANIVRLA